MTTQSKLVTVTGASGFIAAHIVRELLARQYRVRGTVRNVAKGKELAHLRALPGAAERLELVEADLLKEGSFDAAVSGASYVLHTASPYIVTVKDPQKELVDPALRGTNNVLASCAKTPGIQRVVLTSSMAAITDAPVAGHVFTEQDWNTLSSLERNPYYYSKKVAERAAWDFVESKKPGWDLVAINPFIVIGPSLTSGLNTSNQMLVDMLKGTYPGIMSLSWGFVDVRDVALAHVLAMETASARGRYLCAGEVLDMRTVVELLRNGGWGEGYQLPKLGMDCAIGDFAAKVSSYTQPSGVGTYLRLNVGQVMRYDNSKIQRELGLRFRDAKRSILDTAADLKKWGHVQSKAA